MTSIEKYNELIKYFKRLGSAAVAFSGGVDSTLLLKAAHDALGDKAIAITASAASFPDREKNEAVSFCENEGIRLIIYDFDEFSVEGFADNPKNRCYICKKALFTKIKELAAAEGIEYVAEGSNTDDMGDYRPGMIAVKELGVISPLRENDMSKADIRENLKRLGIEAWSKQSFACLASRFVYGEKITPEKLKMVGKAEQLLLDLGLRQVRVRIHQMMARIEIAPDEFYKIFENDNAKRINDELKSYGFSYVSLDLGGYRTGSMNDSVIYK